MDYGAFVNLITGGGRVTKYTKAGSHFVYEYHLKDHLGNTRVAFEATSANSLKVVQKADYYPFGLQMKGKYMNNGNKYLYNGKELQDDVLGSVALGLYDFRYRFYDPQICRFFTQDRLAEKFVYMTPYQFCSNDPISKIEIDGLEGADANWAIWAAQNPLGGIADGFRQVFQSWSSLFSFEASATAIVQTTKTVSGDGTNASSSVITENKATFSFTPQNMFNYTGDNNNVPSPFSTSNTQITKTEQKVSVTASVVGKIANLSVAKSQDTQGTQKTTVEAGVGLTNKSSTAAASAYGQVINTTTSNGNKTTSAKVGAKVTVPINTSTTTSTSAVGVKVELEKKLIGN